jgi:AcrR family transcriptional regulator
MMPKMLLDKATTIEEVPRVRNRERTLNELQLALHRLQRAEKKITLRAVAEEAKVSPALLNNRYPDFAEQVRAQMGRTIREQRNEKADLLTRVRERNRQLRALVDSQLVEITQLASVNEALRAELALQKAIADGKVSSFGRKLMQNEIKNSD